MSYSDCWRSAAQTYTEQPSVNVCERIFSFGEKRGEERNICQFGQVISLSASVLATWSRIPGSGTTLNTDAPRYKMMSRRRWAGRDGVTADGVCLPFKSFIADFPPRVRSCQAITEVEDNLCVFQIVWLMVLPSPPSLPVWETHTCHKLRVICHAAGS